MNEDYLWDKTCSDAEIEGLENMLSAFRYRETEAPGLPAVNIVSVVEKAPWWRFSLGFAFAGAMAFVVMGAGLFWLIPRYNAEVSTVRKEISGRAIETPVGNNVPTTERSFSSVPVSKTVSAQPRAVKQVVHTAFRPQRTVAKEEKVEVKDLTKEEKFAYNQLLLALSITSSKLKVVQDTIDNVKPSDRRSFR
ncbi:hypothetical protein BH10ACI2_BH10ACI2_11840 [soil metagenome]